MNTTSKPVKFAFIEYSVDKDVDIKSPEMLLAKLAEITDWGLGEVAALQKRGRERDLTNKSLEAAAGMGKSDDEVLDFNQRKKQFEREKLLSMAKHAEPATLFRALCAGVAKNPSLKANTALWLAQGICNAVSRSAAREYARRKREAGIQQGVHFEQDDAGVFSGYFAGNDPLTARDNRGTPSPFSDFEEPEAIEALFEDWYRSIETQLLALAGASVDINGDPQQAGVFSRWNEAGDIANPRLVQQILDFGQMIEEAMDWSNNKREDKPKGKDVNPFFAY